MLPPDLFLRGVQDIQKLSFPFIMASPGKSCWFGDVQNVFLAASSILERLHSESRNEGLENDFSFQLGLWKSKTIKRMVPNLG